MTDNEIIKALECCKQNCLSKCLNCPAGKVYEFCSQKIINEAIDLINRLKAENERLESLCEKIGIANDAKFERICVLQEDLETAKSEARKEFAEKLKEVYVTHEGLAITIDNLLKEMESET